MTTSAAGATGITFAGLEQAVPAIQDVSDMLAAFRTLSTVPAAALGSGCPATGAAITALGAEIVGVVVQLVEKLETDSKTLAANITKYAENEASTVLGLNTVAGGLGGAATSALTPTATTAAPLTVAPTAQPVSVTPPVVNNAATAAAAVNSPAGAGLGVGAAATTLGSAVHTDPFVQLIEDIVEGPSVLEDLLGMKPVTVASPTSATTAATTTGSQL